MVRATAEHTVVSVDGEIDAAVTDRLRRCFEDELFLAPRALLVDLTEVSFCSATALGVLVNLHHDALAASVPCVFVTDQRALLRPLALLGLDQVLRIRPTLAEALAGLAS